MADQLKELTKLFRIRSIFSRMFCKDVSEIRKNADRGERGLTQALHMADAAKTCINQSALIISIQERGNNYAVLSDMFTGI